MMMRPLSAARPFASPRSRGSSKPAFATSPSSSTGGTAFATQPAVTVQDASGNTVTTSGLRSPSSSRLPSVGGVLTGDQNPRSTSSGVATFSGCRISVAGTYTLTNLRQSHRLRQQQPHHYRNLKTTPQPASRLITRVDESSTESPRTGTA